MPTIRTWRAHSLTTRHKRPGINAIAPRRRTLQRQISISYGLSLRGSEFFHTDNKDNITVERRTHLMIRARIISIGRICEDVVSTAIRRLRIAAGCGGVVPLWPFAVRGLAFAVLAGEGRAGGLVSVR
jgi:hypothetical protein